MNTQQAYLEGFVKRASEYGLSREEALTLLKQAGPAAPTFTALRASDPRTKGMSPKALEGYNNTQQMRSLLGQQVLPPPTAAPIAGYTRQQLNAAKNDIGNPR